MMAPETTTGEMRARDTEAFLKVYWQPGCSSCLKTKEFLLANGVKFESINVIDDENGFKELAAPVSYTHLTLPTISSV